jgi:acetyltransferase-like isoleucine patch superfamily enzyme
MRKDHRPYILKRLDQGFQQKYAGYFLRPQLERLGRGCTFMKPWYVEVFGGPIRIGDYTHVIATPDKRVRLTVWSNLEGEGRIEIGNYCLVCPGVRISAGREIIIEESVMMAQGAFITDSDWHGVYNRSLSVGKSGPVRVERNAWIGDSAIVTKGVTIGRNSIVGAGAVVVRDVPSNVVVAGNPAVIVKELEPDRPVVTRGDWMADPKELAARFAAIDRERMKDNTWLGWLRSLIRPIEGD